MLLVSYTALAMLNVLELQAAHTLHSCGPSKTSSMIHAEMLGMCLLQVTHTALATHDVLERLCPAGGASPFRSLIRDLLLYFATTYKVGAACFDIGAHPACKVVSMQNMCRSSPLEC